MSDWQPIETAPHDRAVRIKCDDGSTKGLMRFRPPHYWDAPHGILRIADGHLYDGNDFAKATHWRD
jgi:hypothetical protein